MTPLQRWSESPTPPHGTAPVLRPELVNQFPYQQPVPVSTDPRVVAGFVLALLSYVLLPVVGAITGLVLVAGAKRRIRAAEGRLAGSGLVTATKLLAWVNLILCVMVAVALYFLGMWFADFVRSLDVPGLLPPMDESFFVV